MYINPYWNLIFFSFIGALFAVIAMLLVDADDKSGIALLYLGLVGGYAASIKELDLAKIEIDKLKLEKGVDVDRAETESAENNGKENET